MGMRMAQMSRIFVEKIGDISVIRVPFRTAIAIPSKSRSGPGSLGRATIRHPPGNSLDSTKISYQKIYL
jgi:hypothetical protein